MRSRRAAEAFAVKRSGGIQGMSMWQSAEILVYFIVSPSILSAWRRRRGTPPGGKHDEQIGQPPHGSLPGIWSAHNTPSWPHPTGRPALTAQVVLPHFRISEQVLPRALEAVPAQLEDEGPVRDGQRLLRVLLHHEHRGALPVDGHDGGEDRLDHAWIETKGGLVDEQQPGMEEEGDGHLEDLLLAARERAGQRSALGPEHGKALHQYLDVARHLGIAARVRAHLLPREPDTAPGELDHAEHATEERRLPRAVGADDRHDLVGTDVRGDPV